LDDAQSTAKHLFGDSSLLAAMAGRPKGMWDDISAAF
jgi:hypothetical protein